MSGERAPAPEAAFNAPLQEEQSSIERRNLDAGSSRGVGLVWVDGEDADNQRRVVEVHLMALDAAQLLQGGVRQGLPATLSRWRNQAAASSGGRENSSKALMALAAYISDGPPPM